MKKNLSMILIKKISRSGVKNAPLFSKFGTKKYLPEGKMGFRAFALNMPHYSEQINCSGFLYFALLVQIFFYL